MLPEVVTPIHVLQSGPWLADELRAAIPAPFVVHALHLEADPQGAIDRLGDGVQALLCHSGGPPTDRALLDRLPRLSLIINLGAGTDSVDLDAAAQRGIPVLDGVGFNAIDVAELAFGLVLALARGLIHGDRMVREGRWSETRSILGHRVSGRRLGILGMGSIGQHLARRAAAFDMEVSYFSRRPVAGVPWTHVPDVVRLAEASDFLVSALPGGHATRHVVDGRVLDALGSRGCLVSVGRGTVVDEDALVRALEEGRIAGAALDVFENEPEVPAGLVGSSTTVLQAHCGGKTHEAYRTVVEETVRRLKAHFNA